MAVIPGTRTRAREATSRRGLSEWDIAELTWFFTSGLQVFQRSTFGAVLERQQNLAVGARNYPTHADSWHVVKLHEQRVEAGYTPDDGVMVRAAATSRRLRLIGRGHEQTLAAYYGNEGAAWVGSKAGAIVALYPLTTWGGKFVTEQIAREQKLGKSTDLRSAMRFALELNHQESSPSDERKELLAVVHHQAEQLLAGAWNAWLTANQTEAAAEARSS